ncbi:carboxymuconolactone decarboxylase family protein [Actinomycetes bacterium KLBMP 9759]
MCYQQRSDLNRIPAMGELARPELDAFMALHETAFRDGGAVPRKYRELAALAVAMHKGCGYCVDTHTTAALGAGAVAAEIAEITFVAAAVAAGAAGAHGLLALRLGEGA